MTTYAQSILDIVNRSTEHPTAERIHEILKEKGSHIALATVYNNLAWLDTHGMIRRLRFAGSPDRYDKLRRHDHLICKKCHAITDVDLPDLTQKIETQIHHGILFYDLKINYICDKCASAQEASDLSASPRRTHQRTEKSMI